MAKWFFDTGDEIGQGPRDTADGRPVRNVGDAAADPGPAVAACQWVFNRYGKAIKNFYGAWSEASQRAGLWDKAAKKPTRIFHDLRRTGARNLVRAGAPERVVM